MDNLDSIETQLNALATPFGMTYSELCYKPRSCPLDVLKAIYELLLKKFELQKELYLSQGGDLSNVVFLSSRR